MREMSFVEAAREGLAEEMARDPSIFVVGEGVGPRGGNFNTTVGLFDLFGPERLRDTPISERGFTAMCTGAAATGSRPEEPHIVSALENVDTGRPHRRFEGGLFRGNPDTWPNEQKQGHNQHLPAFRQYHARLYDGEDE